MSPSKSASELRVRIFRRARDIIAITVRQVSAFHVPRTMPPETHSQAQTVALLAAYDQDLFCKESNIFSNLDGQNPGTKAYGNHKIFLLRHRIPYERTVTAARFIPSNCCDMTVFKEASKQEEVIYSVDRNLEYLLKCH